MIPYYVEGGVTIYHADCREVLPTLDPVDLIVTSPPYNLGGQKASGTYFRNLQDGYECTSDDLPDADYQTDQRTILHLMWRCLSDSGAIFYNHKPRVGGDRVWLPSFVLDSGLPLRQIIVWDRGSGFNRQFAYFVPSYEWIMLLAKPDFRLTTRSVDDVWRIPPASGSAAEDHPAPFPLAIPKLAIASVETAASVLDPFAGSGSTLRAAKDLGRRAIGIELSERYCEIAARRLGQEVMDFGASDLALTTGEH